MLNIDELKQEECQPEPEKKTIEHYRGKWTGKNSKGFGKVVFMDGVMYFEDECGNVPGCQHSMSVEQGFDGDGASIAIATVKFYVSLPDTK